MCFGPFTKICHWGPLTALGIIKCVTGMTIHCCSMWWPVTDHGGFFNTLVFISLSGLTLYNFLSSIYHGPGYLPLGWSPVWDDKETTKSLQWCGVCQGYKAPRSHHCRKCGRCVLKMDHHCPWINNCVGWGNHAHFTAFLFFAVLGCLHASVILSCSLIRAIYKGRYGHYTYEPVYLNLWGLVLCVFSLGLSIGVVLAVGMLLFFQIRAIVRNRTGIEDWILEKANYRRRNTQEKFKFPYNLGFYRNVQQVLNASCTPVGDGINWEVAEGCDQYTLTREQIEQKNEKRSRSKLYSITKAVSGSWMPIMQGFRVCCNPPCTDEPRIKLNPGDIVLVTRWRKHWLFGEKIQENLSETDRYLLRSRGWFPRRCAVEMTDGEYLQSTSEKKRK